MSALDHEAFPRGALIAAAGLVSFSLVATILGNHAGLGNHLGRVASTIPPISAPAREVSLAFADQTDGSVQVKDFASGRVLGVLPAGSDGFVRGVMRGMAHERMAHHITSGPGFHLVEGTDRRVVLEDPATGRRIDLNAFGDINLKAFSRFLPATGGVS